MYEEILAGLVAKFPGLAKNFLGTLATQLATKVTEKTQIEGAIAGLDNLPLSIPVMAQAFASEGDRRATEAVQTHLKANPPKQEEKKEEIVVTPTGDPALLAQMKAMQDRLDASDLKEALATKKSELQVALKAAGIPEAFADNFSLTKDTVVADVVPGIKTNFEAVRQTILTTGMKENSFLPGGKGAEGSDVTNQAAVTADIKQWADSQNPVAAATPAK